MNKPNQIFFQITSRGERRVIAKPYQDLYVIGRRSTAGVQVNDIFLDDPYTSRKHCRLHRDDSAVWWVEDLGSSNGTKLNGQLLTGRANYREKDVIQIGETRLALSVTGFADEDDEDSHTLLITQNMVDVAAGDLTIIQAVPVSPAASPSESAPSPADEDENATLFNKPSPSRDDATSSLATSIWSGKTAGSESEQTRKSSPQPEGGPSQGKSSKAATPESEQSRKPPPRPDGSAFQGKEGSRQEEAHHHGGASSGSTSPEDEFMRSLLTHEFIRGLISQGFVNRDELTPLMTQSRNTGKTFFRVLWESKETRIQEVEKLFRWVSKQYDFRLWDEKDERELGERAISPPWFSYSEGLKLGAVPLSGNKNEERVKYATVDPFDLGIRSHIERCDKRESEPVLVLPGVFDKIIKGLADQDKEFKEAGEVIDYNNELEVYFREHLSTVTVPEMINFFLYRSYRRGASDIHVEPTEDALLVRIRVDGILHEEFNLPVTFHREVVSRLKIMSGMDVAEKRRPQDGRFSRVIVNSPIDVRVSSYPTVHGEKFVLRLLDKSALRPSIDKLNMMVRDLVLLKEKIAAPHGLIMISGPTGSGKTTTLYSCLSSLDKDTRNVLTVEDPVEYRLKGVHQMQVNHKIGVTFASGLRTILRQDPDVIMVGEIRDQETASMAVQASLTGHIVFSTIHTNDAVGVITRLLDMKIEPFLVATSLSMAIAQRLVRCICPNPNCRVPVSGADVLKKLNKDGITKGRLEELGVIVDPSNYYVEGKGCPECMFTGYQGRQAVFEVFEMTSQARNAIMAPNFSADKLHALAREAKMTTLIEHGMKLVEDERTTFFEIIRVLGENS